MFMKLFKKYFIVFLLFFILNVFLMPDNSSKQTNIVKPIEYFDRVKNTEYYDWSEVKTLDQEYSFSTIYLTEKTEFKILKNDGKVTWKKTQSGKDLPNITNLGKGKELIMLVTNCAINKNGDILDVLIKIDKVTAFGSGSGETGVGTVELIANNYVTKLESQNHPNKGTKSYNDIGKPMIFGLNATHASCDFTIVYYKHGTYDYATNSGEFGNINLVNGIFSDIDVKCESCKSTAFLRGNEGVRPNVGSSIIYYNKQGKDPTDANYKSTRLQEIDNGISIKSAKSNSDGLWFGHSALILTRDIANSTYSFTYGGEGCGIDYFFSSPYPYDIPNPTKKASVKEISAGQEFYYEINQYIPNNYYVDLFNYNEIYNNFYNNASFTSIIIKDNFNKSLEINRDMINIRNEFGEDVTEKFTISLNNNELIIASKTDNFIDPNFYNHIYTIQVPTILKNDVKDISNIKNITTVNSKIGDEEEKILPSNEVIIDIIYKLIVNYLKEGTNEKVSESKEEKYKLNDNYVTDYPTINNLELVGIPNNASGIIKENTIVNYYYGEQKLENIIVEKPIIENPNTGKNGKFIIILMIPLLILIYYLRKFHKKIYKI